MEFTPCIYHMGEYVWLLIPFYDNQIRASVAWESIRNSHAQLSREFPLTPKCQNTPQKSQKDEAFE